MFSPIFRDLAKPTQLEIIAALKRSEGLPITELAKELEMSYMGVKQHCLSLEQKGYLESKRVPRSQVGRPEKLYVLTKRCDPLFPSAGVGLTLDVMHAVKALYGEAAPEKLLFHHFQEKKKQWGPKVRAGKSLVEKATRLVDLRNKEGCFSHCRYDSEKGLRIEEYHHPMQMLYELYPSARRLELLMIKELLGTEVDFLPASKGGEQGVYCALYRLRSL